MIGRIVPPVAWTARVLSVGTVASAGCFLLGLGLAFAGAPAAAAIASAAGVVTLLLTPGAGLVVSAVELRAHQPQAALLALGVLAVLAAAVLVALLAG